MTVQRIGSAKQPCPSFLVMVGERTFRFACAKPRGHQSKHKTVAGISYLLPTGLTLVFEHPLEWAEVL